MPCYKIIHEVVQLLDVKHTFQIDKNYFSSLDPRKGALCASSMIYFLQKVFHEGDDDTRAVTEHDIRFLEEYRMQIRNCQNKPKFIY